jgi:hypothetical protein
LPRFVARVYGGNPADQAVVEGEALARFRYQFVDTLSYVQITIFSEPSLLLSESRAVGSRHIGRRVDAEAAGQSV